ncbi:MAG TPA: acyl carrier protein [Burkholderiales bacterium]|nr:acyl carrier protein [Burkholderiales bacterium]
MSAADDVRSLIAATLKLPIDKITPTTRYGDFAAWDSLGQVNLIMALEQTFDVYIEAEEFADLNSVAAIVTFLEARGIR